MKTSPLAVIVLILNVLGLGTMLVALLSIASEGYEEIIYYGAAGILGAVQLFGAFLLLFCMKTMTPTTRKNLAIYWVLASADILFTMIASSIDDDNITIGIGIGLILSIYHFYINVRTLKKNNVVTLENL